MIKNTLKTYNYDGEILEAVKSVSLKAENQTSAQEGQFSSVVNSVNSATQGIINSIENEHQRSRIQSRIQSEILESGFSKTQYQLANIGTGITGLENRMRQSSDNIIAEIRKSGINIADKLETSNKELASISNNSAQAVLLLTVVKDSLINIIEKISRPNEVQAIELADQARINLAIGKKEEALRVTRKAMERCGTSITVTAYHLITLSLFDEKELVEESLGVFNDFVNLVDVLLFDKIESRKAVQEEIYCMIFPTIFALNRTLDGIILNKTERLFKSIGRDIDTINRLLEKPLLDPFIREKISGSRTVDLPIWIIILNTLIIANKVYTFLPHYITAVSKLDLMSKNELLYCANEILVSSSLLYDILSKDWNSDPLNNNEQDCLQIFFSMQPQKNLILCPKALLMLTHRYIQDHSVEISSEFDDILHDFTKSMLSDVGEKYLAPYVQIKTDISVKEKETLILLKEKTSQFGLAIQKKSRELEREKQNYLQQKRRLNNSILDKQENIELLGSKVVSLYKEIPKYTVALPAVLVGALIANVTNFDVFGGFNWFILVVSTLAVGSPLFLNLLEKIDSMKYDKARQHQITITNEETLISKSKQEIAELDQKLRNLPSIENNLRIDSEKKLIDVAQTTIVKSVKNAVVDLNTLQDQLLHIYYPSNVNVSRSIADLGELIGAKTPKSIEISNEFMEDFCLLFAEIRDSGINSTTLKTKLLGH